MAKKKDRISDRAIRYARAVVAFQNVGAGPDRNLTLVHDIVNGLLFLCKDETGIWLDRYPTDVAKVKQSNEVGKHGK